jgi:glycine/D-amino acid oxidase-like deaminating enzyme
MSREPPHCDALVIGAGFYGAEVALELKRQGLKRVVLVEREPDILRRASYVNQARVHNGYHYPRSLSTAERSRANFEAFVVDYAHAVHLGMESVYAIARESRVSAAQFEAFCKTIRSPCRVAPRRISDLFDASLIEEVFVTREFVFNARILKERLDSQLAAADVDLRLGTEARVLGATESGVEVLVAGEIERAAYVFNCTYADIEFAGVGLKTPVKRELTELVLFSPPSPIDGLAITVMDGPFFSAIPFPAAGLYSLSHVRYTPHESSVAGADEPLVPVRSHRNAMIRDAQRYLPALAGARIVESLFEIKAVLSRNEADDGRPILIEQHEAAPRIFSILGSKIDNIYEVKEFLRSQNWCGSR